MLKAAQDVGEALRAAKISQDAARAAINNATVDIMEAGKDLTTTSNGTDSAEVTAASSLEAALLLQQRLRDVEKNFTANRLNVQKAETETRNMELLVTDVDKVTFSQSWLVSKSGWCSARPALWEKGTE